MKAFTDLYRRLDQTTRTGVKIEAMAEYFRTAPPADAAWALFFLSGRRFKRLMGWVELRSLAREVAGLPEWLFEESYAAVGDLAETISLLVETAASPDNRSLSYWVESRLLSLRDLDEAGRRQALRTGGLELD